MLKTRIIPTLLWKDFGLVKGVAFDSWRRVGTVLPAITVYNSRDVDELVLLDITATPQQREPDYDAVRDFAGQCFVPLTIGGGVNSIEAIRGLLRAGADKVAINSAAYARPELIGEAAGRFGSQCVVVSIDARRDEQGRYSCYSHCGQQATGQELVAWARRVEELGAGEILLTAIDRDGTQQGYDLDMIRQVSEAVTIPVIASGGAGQPEHFLQALQHGADAVAAASLFHFTEKTPADIKNYLRQQGIAVRNVQQRGPGHASP